MLTEKTWPPESVIRLLLSQLLCLFIGGVAVEVFFPSASHAQAERQRMSMIIGTLSFQGAGIACIAYFLRSVQTSWRDAFGLGWPGNLKSLLIGGLAGVGMLPITLLLGQLSAWVMMHFNTTPEVQVAVRVLQVEESPLLKLYLGVFTILVAPIGEELLFRGILYPTLRSVVHPSIALWGTSLFFAAIHLNVMTFVPLTVLALVLTRLYQQTGNILAPIVTHALFNCANFLFVIFNLDPRF